MSIVERLLGRKKIPQPENDIDVIKQRIEQHNRDLAERPLSPLLQKNKDIVEQFAKKHELKIKVWNGHFSLEKDFGDNITGEVVQINNYHEGYIAIHVYQAGPDGYLSKANNELLKPINKGGKGDDVILINRDVKDPSIGGLIVVDTAKARAKLNHNK